MTGRKPLAWIGVFDEPDPEFIWYDHGEAGRWLDTRPGVELAPLFLGLTDAEREAVELAAEIVEELAHPETSVTAATLRELLERMTL